MDDSNNGVIILLSDSDDNDDDIVEVAQVQMAWDVSNVVSSSSNICVTPESRQSQLNSTNIAAGFPTCNSTGNSLSVFPHTATVRDSLYSPSVSSSTAGTDTFDIACLSLLFFAFYFILIQKL